MQDSHMYLVSLRQQDRRDAAEAYRLRRELRAAASSQPSAARTAVERARLAVAFRLVELGLRLAGPPGAAAFRERR